MLYVKTNLEFKTKNYCFRYVEKHLVGVYEHQNLNKQLSKQFYNSGMSFTHPFSTTVKTYFQLVILTLFT